MTKPAPAKRSMVAGGVPGAKPDGEGPKASQPRAGRNRTRVSTSRPVRESTGVMFRMRPYRPKDRARPRATAGTLPARTTCWPTPRTARPMAAHWTGRSRFFRKVTPKKTFTSGLM